MNIHKGYGAILGDMIGSSYEFKNKIKSREFDWFNPANHYTDDTIMTLATMEAINDQSYNYGAAYKWWGSMYQGDYYGKAFAEWLNKNDDSANWSYGNGSAMRVSPIGYHFQKLDYVLQESIRSTMPSHTHHEAIKGAQCIATCIFMLNNGSTKKEVSDFVADNYYYTAADQLLVQFPKFKVSCQDTVPVAIQAFLLHDDIESLLRSCVWMGGDCDTIGSMAAELWVAHNGGLDQKYVDQVENGLDSTMLSTLHEFNGTQRNTIQRPELL